MRSVRGKKSSWLLGCIASSKRENIVYYIKGETQAKDIWKHDTETNILAEEGLKLQQCKWRHLN